MGSENHVLTKSSSTFRTWESLSNVTCCKSLAVVYDGICILQAGFAGVSCSNGGEPILVDADNLMKGSLYNGVVKSGSRKVLSSVYFVPQATILLPLFGM